MKLKAVVVILILFVGILSRGCGEGRAPKESRPESGGSEGNESTPDTSGPTGRGC